jgi:hypothetical protein
MVEAMVRSVSIHAYATRRGSFCGIGTMLLDRRAPIVLGAIVLGFASRLELAHLDVRPAHRKMPPLIAQDKYGHRLQFSSASPPPPGS